jgi:hypothetical protein
VSGLAVYPQSFKPAVMKFAIILHLPLKTLKPLC